MDETFKQGNMVTEEECKILLVGAILKQVYDDYNISPTMIKKAYKSWKKEEAKKKKNINAINNKKRYYKELVNVKKDAINFVSLKSNRIKNLIRYWRLDLSPYYIHKILTGPLPFMIK